MRLWAGLAVVGLLAGCGGGGEPAGGRGGELETVEVGAAQDDEIDLSNDPVGRRAVESVSGVLPGDFPADLPVYRPSSVVDFGATADGGRFVLFAVGDPPATARSRLERELAAAGWEVRPGGPQALIAARGGRAARFSFGDLGGSAEIRVEYRLP